MVAESQISDAAEAVGPFGRLDELPRVRMADAPTPLERLRNLEAQIGGPALYAKRDDTQPIAFGGNKVRQLEFYFGDALDQGADTVLITGAVQSNFCRTCAAFAAKLGMECHIQMEDRVPKNDPLYRQSGNVLVSRLLGADLTIFPRGEDEEGADAELEDLAQRLRDDGRKPYVIHLAPGHAPIGALGYIEAAREIAGQLEADGTDPTGYVVPSGSGATHTGLLFGLRALGIETPVLGICVRRDAGQQRPRLVRRCAEIAEILGIPSPVTEDDIQITDAFLAPGYGILNEPTREAITTGAKTEALMLDPVYSGKAMAGFLDWARSAGSDDCLVFVHTGGTPGIFAYGNALNEACGWDNG